MHYSREAKRAKAAGETPDPKARGGRRTQKPPNPNSLANLRKWKPGESGNASGRSSEYVELIRTARKMCPATLKKLYEIAAAIDPRSPTQAQVAAINSILDRGLGRPAQAVFHGGPNQVGNMPTAVELMADDAIVTPLTAAARQGQGAEYEATLRAELRRIDEARAKAAAAKAIADRAEGEKNRAATIVEQLRFELTKLQSSATEADAKALTEAFKQAQLLPDVPPQPEGDSTALSFALARLRALHLSACELAGEANRAQDEANAATMACRDLIDVIITADARAVAAEWIAATRLCWELQDRLTGFVRLNGGALFPHEQQSEILDQINRRKAAIVGDPRLIENHHWITYLDGLTADQERAWQDYIRRLMNDPAASFDDAELPS